MATADSHPFEEAFGVLQRQADSLDRSYITDWAKRLGIWEEWQYVQSQTDNSMP